MGTWGTGINQNDTFLDLTDEFTNLYNVNYEVVDIPRIIQERQKDSDYTDEDYAIFWLAMAHCQWNCGSLQTEVLDRVIDIYKTEKGLELWREENGADKGAFDKHKEAIRKFIEKIKTPQKTPQKRLVLLPSYFKRGDCLSIKLSNGFFGAAYVIAEDDNDLGDERTIVAFIDYFSKEVPSVKDIIQRNLLRHDFDGGKEFAIKLVLVRSMTRYLKKINAIGAFKPSDYATNFLDTKFIHVPIGDIWQWRDTDKFLLNQFEFDKARIKDYEHITVLQLMSDNCENHWYRLKGWYNRIK